MRKIFPPLAALALFTAAANGADVPAGYLDEKDVSKIWSEKRPSTTPRWPAPQPLFAADLSNADMKPGSWDYTDGVLTAKGGGNIWTKEIYGDFALNLDFRCEAKSNSGVFFRCSDIVNWLNNALEVQILQGDAPNDKHLVGGLLDVSAPSRQIEIEPGKWHHFTIIAKGQKIQVILDGERVTNIDLGEWKETGKNPDGTKNKYQNACKDMPLKGRIGLQYDGQPISFRNIVIERIGGIL